MKKVEHFPEAQDKNPSPSARRLLTRRNFLIAAVLKYTVTGIAFGIFVLMKRCKNHRQQTSSEAQSLAISRNKEGTMEEN